MTQLNAAQRIVDIQASLARKLSSEARRDLTTEQKSLWDQFYPSQPYEKVAGAAVN